MQCESFLAYNASGYTRFYPIFTKLNTKSNNNFFSQSISNYVEKMLLYGYILNGNSPNKQLEEEHCSVFCESFVLCYIVTVKIGGKSSQQKRQFFLRNPRRKERRRKKLKNQVLVAFVLVEIITVEKISFLKNGLLKNNLGAIHK